MFADVLAQLGVVSAFVMKAVNLLKPLYQKSEYQKYIDVALSLVLSAALCVAWGVDLLAVAGIVFSQFPWVGALVTGIVAALGAGVLNDVLALLEMWKNQKKEEMRLQRAYVDAVAEASTPKPVDEKNFE